MAVGYGAGALFVGAAAVLAVVLLREPAVADLLPAESGGAVSAQGVSPEAGLR